MPRLIRVSALLMVQLCLAGVLDAQIPQSERDALEALYTSTNGANWANNEGWFGAPGTECDWFGVTCDADGLHVQEIDLEWNNLVGTIAPELVRLTQLWSLVLGHNRLSGTIPLGLTTLSNLGRLALNDNELTENIPPEIGNLANLRYMLLAFNRLTGTLPPELGNLSRLKVLDLWTNGVTGSIPPELGNLGNLEYLDLSSNHITGSIPPSLRSLDILSNLDLGGNRLTGIIPPELGNLTTLVTLYLQGNELTGTIPPELGNLANLELLKLNANELTGGIPSQLGDLSNVRSLNLGANGLTGTIPPELGNLSSARTLVLNSNRLSGTIPAELAGLTGLGQLNLANNLLTGSIPAWLGTLPSLSSLSLSDNRLTGTMPPELGTNGWWSDLFVARNRLTGTIPIEFMSADVSVYRLDFGWNALHADDVDLVDFVNARPPGSAGPGYDFRDTQTLAAEDLTASPQGLGAVLLTWTPVTYTANDGAYRVHLATQQTGPFEFVDETADKTVSWMTVDGLSPNQSYAFFVDTVTYPHADNQNAVVSEPSAVVTATTAPAGVAGVVQLAFNAQRASEGESKLITVRRLGGAAGQVSVEYTTASGSASAGSDFIPNSGTLTWQDGDGEPRTFTVFVVDDNQPEGDETLTVTLANPNGGVQLGSPASAVLTIADSDFYPDHEGDTSSAGRRPAVATDPDGNRFVVWDEVGVDSDGLGVVAQRYDPTGATTGDRFLVNLTTAGDQHSPGVAADNGGRFIVVWEHDVEAARKTWQVGHGVFGRLFAGDGTPLTAELVVDDGSFGEASDPAVAVEPTSGRFVVVWKREPGGKTATDGAGIFGRYFDPSGQPVGDVIVVSQPAQGVVEAPEVAVNDDGEVVVVWALAGPDGWLDVFARQLDGISKALGPAILVNEDTWRHQQSPAVVVREDGSFLVAWQGPSLPDDESGGRVIGADIFGRLFDPSAAPQGDAFEINDTLVHSQTAPDLATNPTGDCWAVWTDEDLTSGVGIFGRPLHDCGAPGSGDDAVQLDDPLAEAAPRTPSIALAEGGAVTAVFGKDDLIEGDGGIAGRGIGQQAPSVCIPAADTLCLNQSRFEVKVTWRDFAGNAGDGQSVPLTTDTGYFWFFDAANVELVVKVLDGTAINGAYWVFFGALSNVEYTLTVRDTVTGRLATYANPAGTFASVGDTGALPGDRKVRVTSGSGPRARESSPKTVASVRTELLPPPCPSGPHTLCLNNERFQVEVSWSDFDGNTGSGQAVPLTSDTGYFWFFNQANVELVVKVLDGRGINGHFWVFYGALSNVAYTITVTDTTTGASTTYDNPLGEFGSVGDTEAFAAP